MLSGLSRIFRKPVANVHISRKVTFAHVWQVYACGPRSCKTFHGFLHGPHIPRTQMTHILEDLTHKMEGQPPKKQVSWVIGIQMYIFMKSSHEWALKKCPQSLGQWGQSWWQWGPSGWVEFTSCQPWNFVDGYPEIPPYSALKKEIGPQ